MKSVGGTAIPGWAESVRQKYVGGESSLFLLHGNVYDIVLHGGREYSLESFLAGVLLKGNKDLVVAYDPANGIRYLKKPANFTEPFSRDDESQDPLAQLQKILESEDRVAVIVHYAGSLAPVGEDNMLSAQDRINAVRLHLWSLSATLSTKDNVVFLLSESVAELNARLVSNPRVSAIRLPLPGLEERREMVGRQDPSIDADNRGRLAEAMSGLSLVQIDQLLSPRGAEPLVASVRRQAEAADKPAADPYAEVLALVRARKREIIERECFGLIEFMDGKHGLDAVGGNEQIKAELESIAESLRSGDRLRAPMGLLFVGPMGTGKTFVAKAFIRSSGLSGVALKNFRSKWVGSTEANLEKVLGMIRALGPTVLVIDEGDRSFGGQSEDSDGGTSSRIIARLKEFMSDPENRGVVVFLLMTNRPDKLDVDIKRAGRLDVKIPFFYEYSEAGVRAILEAIGRRYAIPTEALQSCASLVGYSNADLEAVVLLAANYAHREGSAVTADIFRRAAEDYLPSRDAAMLEFMELLAVFEASRRSMLPEKFRNISAEELGQRMARLQVSHRR
jgi:transitional endoplasmic reticulum ATPase